MTTDLIAGNDIDDYYNIIPVKANCEGVKDQAIVYCIELTGDLTAWPSPKLIPMTCVFIGIELMTQCIVDNGPMTWYYLFLYWGQKYWYCQ